MRGGSVSERPLDHFQSAAIISDEELLAKAASGDSAAFDMLITRHESALMRFATRICGTRGSAEDAAQEALLAAWRDAGAYRGGSAVRTWMFSIMVNTCRHQVRLRAGEPQVKASLEGAAALSGGEPSPELRAHLSELGRTLERALGQMDLESREVLMLRDVEGLSGGEVAEALGLSLAAMKSRLHRARLDLKKRTEAILHASVEEQLK